jgi:hypothetical protein
MESIEAKGAWRRSNWLSQPHVSQLAFSERGEAVRRGAAVPKRRLEPPPG